MYGLQPKKRSSLPSLYLLAILVAFLATRPEVRAAIALIPQAVAKILSHR